MLTKTTKNRFFRKLDNIFWFLISFAPFIFYLAYLLFNSSDPIAFTTFCTSKFLRGFDYTLNPVWRAIYYLFSPSGAFPLFTATDDLFFFYWLVMTEILHIFFDVIVFIPRLAHKWISKAVQDD